MTRRSKWRIWLVLALLLGAVVACRQAPEESAAGQQFEEFTDETLTQYQGKAIMLSFWATWCPPCRAEMPDMEAIYRKYRDQGLVILAVNAGESDGDIAAFVNELDLTFPIFRDSKGKARSAYAIRVLPTNLFINKEGQIVTRKVGALDQLAISAQIEALIK